MSGANADAMAHVAGRATAAPLAAPAGLKAMFGILIAIGAVTFLTGIGSDPTRAYAAFLLGYVYFLFVALSGTFFSAIHYLAGSTWSVVVRRVAESFTSFLPVALLLFFVLLLGVPHLYVWSSPSVVHGAEAAQVSKGGYLSIPFFAARCIVILVGWVLLSWILVRNSTRQDTTGDPAYSRANMKTAPIFVVFFALSITLFGFDLLMSLEPLWYSTMFGVYCFAGLWQSGLAMLAIAVVLLKRQGALSGIVSRFHYHDLGKYLFAFSVFWMYIAFSQYMLIWYANLPEETEYMIPRTFSAWGTVGILLMVLKFGIPFFGLLHQKVKESEAGLLAIAAAVLIGQWVDLYWTILPAFSPTRVVLGWTEIGVTLGFLGLFGWTVLGFLGRHPVAPHGDPFYDSSVRFHG
ncbi:MAG TPA: molybdopterin oxidoreductase [Candidatus Eisenbacteria bacterium]